MGVGVCGTVDDLNDLHALDSIKSGPEVATESPENYQSFGVVKDWSGVKPRCY